MNFGDSDIFGFLVQVMFKFFGNLIGSDNYLSVTFSVTHRRIDCQLKSHVASLGITIALMRVEITQSHYEFTNADQFRGVTDTAVTQSDP